MATLDFSKESSIQLELLSSKEEKTIRNVQKVMEKVKELCLKETGMSLEELLEVSNHAINRYEAIQKELSSRKGF